jgi:hypothetical protein
MLSTALSQQMPVLNTIARFGISQAFQPQVLKPFPWMFSDLDVCNSNGICTGNLIFLYTSHITSAFYELNRMVDCSVSIRVIHAIIFRE